jgi:DNA-binding transcriptional LysR family regulator
MAENRPMDIASLEILVAAIEEKSLSRAADRVHVVTSAASKRITELERQLGTRLLRRHGRGVEATPAGAMLYQQAKAILRTLAQVQTSLGAYSASGVPKIRLVANSSAVQQFLPSEISSFSRKAPDSRVDLMEAFSYDVPRIVADGEADIGVYHAAHPAAGVVSMPYRTDRVGLVVPVGHALARRETLRLEDALDYDFLGYFPRHSVEEFMQLIAPALTRPLRVRAQVSNPEARCELVREGLGLAIVPVGIARNYEARMGLVVLPLEDDWAHRQLWVCVGDRAALSPAAQEFLAHLASGEGRGA